MKQNIFEKAKRALLARVLPIEEAPRFTQFRLGKCKTCLYNSINFEHYSWIDLFKMNLNKLLDFLFLKKKIDYGVCLHPDCGCNLYLKTKEPEEECPIDHWKSVYIPNTKSEKGKWKI